MAIEYRIVEHADRKTAMLHISGDLDFEARSVFKQATGELLATAQPKLAIDLSAILRMSSMYLGTLVDVAAQATQADKKLSVMLQERMSRVCIDAGLDKLMSIIVVAG